MTHQFLYHFHVLTVGYQHRRIRMPKRMPADAFLNASSKLSWSNRPGEQHRRPVRISTLHVRVRKHPIVSLSILALLLPIHKFGDNIIGQRQILDVSDLHLPIVRM